MIAVGFGVGLVFAVAILVLFVHRPLECGEPAACGDGHLFPALYFSGLALGATVAFAAVKRQPQAAHWRRYLVDLSSWIALLAVALAIAYGIVGSGQH
jgi:hypothetical protein